MALLFAAIWLWAPAFLYAQDPVAQDATVNVGINMISYIYPTLYVDYDGADEKEYSIIIEDGPEFGDLTLSSPEGGSYSLFKVSYEHSGDGSEGTDSFTYKVIGPDDFESEPATITLNFIEGATVPQSFLFFGPDVLGIDFSYDFDIDDYFISPIGLDYGSVKVLGDFPGTFTIVSDDDSAVINYEPLHDPAGSNFFGFFVLIQDEDGLYNNVHRWSIYITGSINDFFEVNQGETVIKDVFENYDADPIAEEVPVNEDEIFVFREPDKGTVVINTDDPRVVEYTPNPGEAGTDHFLMAFKRGASESAPFAVFKVDVEIIEIENEPPEFVSEPVTTVQVNQLYQYHVEASDPDGDPVTLGIKETLPLPEWLEFTDNEDGTGLLQGTPGYIDIGDHHHVQLWASDGMDESSQEFNITVEDDPDHIPPTVHDITVTVGNSGTSYIYVLFQAEAGTYPIDPSSIEIMEPSEISDTGINIEPQPGGEILYIVSGTTTETSDRFTYRVSDTAGQPSNEATVTIEIISEFFDFTTFSYGQLIGEGISPEIDLSGFVIYPFGLEPDTFELLDISDPAGTVNIEDGILTYQHPSPLPDPFGDGIFEIGYRYTVQSVDGTWSPPVSHLLFFSGLLNTTFQVQAGVETELDILEHYQEFLYASDAPINEEVRIVTAPSQGTAVADMDDIGLIHYTAHQDAEGDDLFVVEGYSEGAPWPSPVAAFQIFLDILPDPTPQFTSTFDEETIFIGEEFTFLFSADDPNDLPLQFSLSQGDDIPNASISGDGLFSFTPGPEQTATHEFTVQVSNGEQVNGHSFTVTVVGMHPLEFTVTFDEETIAEGDTLVFQFEAEGPDGDELTFSLEQGTDVENVSFTGEGLFTFAPDFGQAGDYEFTIRVSDGSLFDEHDFAITVVPTNRPPVAGNVMASTRINISISIDLMEFVSDPDGDELEIVGVSAPQHGQAVLSRGTATYTPTINFTGTDSFEYTVSDTDGATDTGVVAIEVLSLAFSIRDIALPEGTLSRAFDISDESHVVGIFSEPGGSASAFMWVDEDLFEISGLNQAFGVNNSGTVAGFAEEFDTALPAMFRNGSLILGGTSGGNFGALFDVNNSDLGTGVSDNGNGTVSGFVWDGNDLQWRGLNDADVQLFSINDEGTAAGFAQLADREEQAVLFLPDGSFELLSNGTGSGSRAFGSGNSGHVAGVTHTDNAFRGAVWQNGSVRELPGLGGSSTIAYGVNDMGVVVGVSGTGTQKTSIETLQALTGMPIHTPSPGKQVSGHWAELQKTALLADDEGLRAVLWIDDEIMDLNELIPSAGDWELIEARAVNNHMHIVGYGRFNGNIRAFLAAPADVEEPIAEAVLETIHSGEEMVVDLHQYLKNIYGSPNISEIRGGSLGFAELRNGRFLHYRAGTIAAMDTVHYRAVDGRGAIADGEVIFSVSDLPDSFELFQNYPNPFNMTTIIPFQLAESGRVMVELYSTDGRRVGILMDQELPRGTHQAELRNMVLSSGMYFYRIRVHNASGQGVFVKTKKMLLVK